MAGSSVRGIICPPGLDRVYWSAKFRGGSGPSSSYTSDMRLLDSWISSFFSSNKLPVQFDEPKKQKQKLYCLEMWLNNFNLGAHFLNNSIFKMMPNFWQPIQKYNNSLEVNLYPSCGKLKPHITIISTYLWKLYFSLNAQPEIQILNVI